MSKNKQTSSGSYQDSTQSQTEPCARITELSLIPDTVAPGDYFDGSATVFNCSNRAETLGLRFEYADTSGVIHRQDFPVPINLGARQSQTFRHPYVAPAEPGTYTIVATVSEGARDLNSMGASLTVRAR